MFVSSLVLGFVAHIDSFRYAQGISNIVKNCIAISISSYQSASKFSFVLGIYQTLEKGDIGRHLRSISYFILHA